MSQKQTKSLISAAIDKALAQRPLAQTNQPVAGQGKKSKKKKSASQKNGLGRVNTSVGSVGAAVSFRPMSTGMSDLMAHKVVYQTGFIYVGNGTLGATDSVYFANRGKTATFPGQVAVVPSDVTIGYPAVADVLKHYARVVFRRVALHLIPLYPSTANSMSVVVAPLRGSGDTQSTLAKTDTTAALAYADVLSCSGINGCSSYEGLSIDLTAYIAGGSGARQNEFDVAGNSTSTFGIAGFSPDTIVPCSFVVSGNNSTTALRGTVTHAVTIELVIDVLDSIGGITPTTVIG